MIVIIIHIYIYASLNHHCCIQSIFLYLSASLHRRGAVKTSHSSLCLAVGPAELAPGVQLTPEWMVRQGSSGTRSPHCAAWIRWGFFLVFPAWSAWKFCENDVQQSWNTSDVPSRCDFRWRVFASSPCCWVVHHSVSEHDVNPRIDKPPAHELIALISQIMYHYLG